MVCGLEHVLLLSQEGQLYTWGSNKKGQLGSSIKDT
ncbi:MAG: RCC1-like domain-containing protein [bacterium]